MSAGTGRSADGSSANHLQCTSGECTLSDPWLDMYQGCQQKVALGLQKVKDLPYGHMLQHCRYCHGPIVYMYWLGGQSLG